jgi:hypothetical protein
MEKFKIIYNFDAKDEKEDNQFHEKMFNNFAGQFLNQLKSKLNFKSEKITMEINKETKEVYLLSIDIPFIVKKQDKPIKEEPLRKPKPSNISPGQGKDESLFKTEKEGGLNG